MQDEINIFCCVGLGWICCELDWCWLRLQNLLILIGIFAALLICNTQFKIKKLNILEIWEMAKSMKFLIKFWKRRRNWCDFGGFEQKNIKLMFIKNCSNYLLLGLLLLFLGLIVRIDLLIRVRLFWTARLFWQNCVEIVQIRCQNNQIAA